MDFSKFNTFIFDLDGTIWCWQKLYPGVDKAVKSIQSKGKQIIFVSNNTLLDRSELVSKLNSLGIDANLEDVISSSYAVAYYLKRFKNKKVLAFGRGLVKELKQNGIKHYNSLPVDFLVVGHDLGFNMKKLSLAFDALNSGAKFLATARGNFFITEKKMIPGTGLIVSIIENMSGEKAEIVGKPSDFMCDLIKKSVKAKMSRTILVGDEINSDIVAGKKLGCYTCLVKTGVDKKADGKIKPDCVVNSVADIMV